MVRIDWDEAKYQDVLERRGVDFIDAAGIFDGPTIYPRGSEA